MLLVEYDANGNRVFTVYNDYDEVIIITGNGLLAKYIADHVKGVPHDKMLTVGGDPGTRTKEPVPIWRFKRVYR